MAVYTITNQEVVLLADAIRDKCQINSSLAFPNEFISAISSIVTIGSTQSKTIVPSDSDQYYVPASGYDGFNTVTVSAISSNYIGSGVTNITSLNYQPAIGAVDIVSGYYSSALSITANYGSIYLDYNGSTTVRLYPDINISINSSTGVVTRSFEISSYITPEFLPGYLSENVYTYLDLSGTSTITLNQKYGNTSTTIIPSSNSIIFASQGDWINASVYIGAIDSAFVGAGYNRISSSSYYAGSSNIVIASKQFLEGIQTIKGDSNLTTNNIKQGVSIFGINGDYINLDDVNFEDAFIMRTLSGRYENSRITSYVDFRFYGCSYLTEVLFPNLSGTINNFNECTNLRYVSLPQVTGIGYYAFAKCYSLSEVYIPNCTIISSSAFISCYMLKSAYFSLCSYVDSDAFAWCSSLESVYLPICSTFGNSVFRYCGISSINLPSCSIMPQYMFFGADIVYAELPMCTNGGMFAFGRCSRLQSFSIPLLSVVAASMFESCGISMVNASNILEVGYFAFAHCSNLKEIHLANCSTISSAAFFSCENLEVIDLPSCEFVNQSGFNSCGNLSYVYLPNCTSLSQVAFGNCSNLISIDFPILQVASSGCFTNCLNLVDISCPMLSIAAFYAFSNCQALETINLPECTTLGNYCFMNDVNLTNVILPKCTSLGSYTFSDCINLKYLYIPNISTGLYNTLSNVLSVETICLGGSYTWYSFYSWSETLKSITLPSVQYVSSYAFRGLRNVEYINLPVCSKLYYSAFVNCNKLQSLYLLSTSVASLDHTMVFESTPIIDSNYLGFYGSIYVPSSLLTAYQTTNNWSYFSSRFVGI